MDGLKCFLDNLGKKYINLYQVTVMFFKHISSRTMGYQQEVVERVIKATGQTEDTFLLLEKIVEETKRCEEGPKVGEKERRLNSLQSPDAPSSSASSSTVSRFREKERELSRVLVDPGRSKENIRPNLHGSSSNGLGHRRQCSGSETSTQQVFFILL